jgi:hypothetical protein
VVPAVLPLDTFVHPYPASTKPPVPRTGVLRVYRPDAN